MSSSEFAEQKIAHPPSAPRVRLLLAALVVGYAALFAWITLTRFAAFESRALDMGNLNQAIWNTAHGDWFHQTNQPGSTNRLSLHVEPILVPISLLYWIHDGPETLLILQAIVVALGAIPVFALARQQRLPDGLALLLAGAWLMMPAIQSANWLEFHPVTLAPTFFMAAFYFLVTKRVGWYALFAVLAASCKEELGLLVAMMGVYALIFLRMWWTGALSIVLGAGWSLFAVLWVQKQFGDNIHWGRFGWLGETPAEMVRALITRPDLLIAQLQRANVCDYFFRLLLPVGFLALLAPEVMLIALPSLAINLLADFPPMHQVTGLIYAAPIAPFVMLAAVMGMGRLWRWTHEEPESGEPANEKIASRKMGVAMWVATGALVAGMAVAQWWYGYLPGMPNYRAYAVSEHDRAAATVITALRPEDRVSAQDKLNPHISGRTTSYIFPDESGIDPTGNARLGLDDPARPDFAANAWLIDVTGSAWPLHPNDVHGRVQELLDEGAGIAAAADGYLLLRADEGAASTEMPSEFYSAWRSPTSTPAYTQTARFGDGLELLGYSLVDDANGDTQLQMYWRALEPVAENVTWLIRYVDANGETVFDSLYYQPVAALWYPVNDWTPGESVLVSTLPWTIPDGAGDEIDIVLGLAKGADANQRLPIASEGVLLEGDTLLHLGTFRRTDGWLGAQWQRIERETTPALLHAKFGERLTLEATSVEPYVTGDKQVQATLQWRLAGEAPQTWNIVLQLLDAAGNRKAQLDTQARVGTVETPLAMLPADRSVHGVYTISLPKALEPGIYTLVVGVNDWNAGAAVAVEGADTVLGEFIWLGTFKVE